MAAPPAYQAVPDDIPPSGLKDQDLDITAPFRDLLIAPNPIEPEPNSCLAHLRLLFAFEALKEDIGYTDGLWGIWDTRSDGNIQVRENGDVIEHPFSADCAPSDEDRAKSLSKLREKRWALYVARAANRYEAWWDSLAREHPPLTEGDMRDLNSPFFGHSVDGENPSWWKKKALPPL
ncbi:large-conductance mechanosensitive channel protein, partial [Fusarium heterosporum]